MTYLHFLQSVKWMCLLIEGFMMKGNPLLNRAHFNPVLVNSFHTLR